MLGRVPIVQHPRSLVGCSWRRSLRQQHHSTCTFAANPFEEREVVGLADAEDPCNQLPTAPFRQDPAEERDALPVRESLLSERQRQRNGCGIGAGEPPRVILERRQSVVAQDQSAGQVSVDVDI